MRQMRIVHKEEPPYKWIDIVHLSQLTYAKQRVDEWRARGIPYDEQRFEFRNKPNIFTRIKEWWNNE